jgi:hypothetical protein
LGLWIEGENLFAMATFGPRKGHLSCCWSRKSTRCMAGAIARASHTKAVAFTNTKSVVWSHRNAPPSKRTGGYNSLDCVSICI